MAKAPAKAGKKKAFKKKEKKIVPTGLVHIQASFNNTIITITDTMGNVLSWSSSGSLGFRGSRKGTPFAAQQASLTAANKAKESGLRSVEVAVSGPGAGRESAVRASGDGGTGSAEHQGQDSHSAQRMQAAQEEKSVAAGLNRSLWSRLGNGRDSESATYRAVTRGSGSVVRARSTKQEERRGKRP